MRRQSVERGSSSYVSHHSCASATASTSSITPSWSKSKDPKDFVSLRRLSSLGIDLPPFGLDALRRLVGTDNHVTDLVVINGQHPTHELQMALDLVLSQCRHQVRFDPVDSLPIRRI